MDTEGSSKIGIPETILIWDCPAWRLFAAPQQTPAGLWRLDPILTATVLGVASCDRTGSGRAKTVQAFQD